MSWSLFLLERRFMPESIWRSCLTVFFWSEMRGSFRNPFLGMERRVSIASKKAMAAMTK